MANKIPKEQWILEVYGLLCQSQGHPENQSEMNNLMDWATSMAETDGEDGYYGSGMTPKEAHDEELSYA